MDRHILVYFCRHGTTEMNKANIFRGQEDVSLDRQGLQDAHKLKFYFSGIDLSYLFCSDRKRSITTADIISQDRVDPLKAKPVPALMPWDIGYLTGEPKDQHKEDMEYYVRNPDVTVPDGESLTEFRNRVLPVVDDAVQLALDCGVPVAIVGHSSVIHTMGTAINGHPEDTLVKPGGVAAIYIENGQLKAEAIYKPGSDDTSFSISGHKHVTPS